MTNVIQIRSIALTAGIAFMCSACANDKFTPTPMQLGGNAFATDAPAPNNTVGEPTGKVKRKHKKTMSDKMLAASALERTTGRKPDPRRFQIFDPD